MSRADYRLDLDGAGGATLRITTPPTKGLAATDQAFLLGPRGMLGVDFFARESIYRPAPDRGPVGLRLTAVLGGLDDSIGFLTASGTRENYLGPLKALTGWKTVPSGLVRQTVAAGKVSQTKLEFDAAGRLKGLHIDLPGSRLDWAITYRPYQKLSLPRALKRVDAFTARPQPPRYADALAKRVVERMLRAGGALNSAIVRIDGHSTVWIEGSKIRYESGASGFAYDGRFLTVRTSGPAYQGRTSRGSVIDYTASLLGTVDPLVRSILVRTPPYLELFTSDAKVRVVGTMATAGQTCDVVAVESPRFRSSIFVRKSDGLPLSIETEPLDLRGNALTRTTRTLAWSSVNGDLPQSLFALRLRNGQATLALPKRSGRAPAIGP